MPRLSLLSRGTGEIQHASTQCVTITLDHHDHSKKPRRFQPGIWKSGGSFTPPTSYMPPPGLYQPRYPRIKREATLPKTYSTKKGELVLYSEEFARIHDQPVSDRAGSYEFERQQLDIRTTDLTLAISRYDESQNRYNRFFRRQNFPEIKPGHSARRHVAAWHLSHPEVNLHGAVGSRFARRPDRRGRKKRIVKTSLTVFPPPYNLPKSFSQIKNGPPEVDGILKARSVHALKTTPVQTTRTRTFASSFSSQRKLAPVENSLTRKEWNRPGTPQLDPDADKMSSASSDLKFTRHRLPPIFKNPSSDGSKLMQEYSGSNQTSTTSSSLRKKVRIQLDPVILPNPSSPGYDSGSR